MSDASLNLKVFISYSRKDGLDFVEQLAAALKVVGVEPMIDRHDIAGGEDWKKRIGGLIAEADSVVFAITPESVASKICEWEIGKTDELAKKVIPVVPARLEGVSLPERLQGLNHVFFYPDRSFPGGGFGKGLADLCEALRTDLSWVRAHTRYGQRAAEWLAGNRAGSRLLSGNDVILAKTWLAERKPNAPEIPDDVRDFIDASEQVEIERRSVERKRLQEKEEILVKMETALNDTKLVQEQREHEQTLAKRRLFGWAVLAAALAVFGSWMYVEAYRSEMRAKGYLDLVGWFGNKALNIEYEATEEQKRVMIDLCDDAIEITDKIAKEKESGIIQADKDKFWNLYFGPLYVVEIFQKNQSSDGPARIMVSKAEFTIPNAMKMPASEIEFSMFKFGGILKGENEGNLVDAAGHVKRACDEFKNGLKEELPDSNGD